MPRRFFIRTWSALKNALGIDAIDSDDESTFDSASAIKFGKMCGSVDLKMTLCPYNKSSYWSAVQSGLGTNCDAIYLQCYDGGAGNDPATWNTYFSGLKVIAGYWDNERSPIFLTNMMTWSNTGGPGGFLWPSCTGCNPPAGAGEMLQYAGWIQTAFFWFQPVITPASGFNAIAANNLQVLPASTTFTLTNGTAGSFSWSLINTSSWLTVTSSSPGTLAPGATTTVTASPEHGDGGNELCHSKHLCGQPRLHQPDPWRLNGVCVHAEHRHYQLARRAQRFQRRDPGRQQRYGRRVRHHGVRPSEQLLSLPAGLGRRPEGGSAIWRHFIQPERQQHCVSDWTIRGGRFVDAGRHLSEIRHADVWPVQMLSIRWRFSAASANAANGVGRGHSLLNFTNGTKSPVFAFNCQDWFNTVTNVAIQGWTLKKARGQFCHGG